MSTFTRVLRWLESSSSSSRMPGRGACAPAGRRRAGGPPIPGETAGSGSSSGASRHGLGRDHADLGRLRCARTSSSMARTVSPSATTARARPSWKARSGVPSRARACPAADLALGQQPLDAGRQLEQAQDVGDGGPALAHPGRHLLVGEAELLDELLVGGGLLQHVEVLPVEVLHQGLLEAVGVVEPSGRGPGWSGGRPAGPPATAARRRSARSSSASHPDRVAPGPAGARRAP